MTGLKRLAVLVPAVFLALGTVTAQNAGTATLTGTVMTDEPNSRPLRGATVTAVVGDVQAQFYATTDDRGRFTLAGLPAGSVRVLAAKMGYVTTTFGAIPGTTIGTPVALVNGKTADITLRIARGAVLAGTVTDENGQPLPGVPVRPRLVRMSALGQRVLSTIGPAANTTDPDGRFRIWGLPAGDYILSVEPRFAGTGDVQQTTAAEVEWAERQIRAAAVSTTGAAAVVPAPAPDPSASDRRQTIDYAPTYFPATLSSRTATVISLAAGQERGGLDVRVQFVSTARIEGVISMPDGSPARAAQVVLIPDDDEGGSAEAARAAVLIEVGLMVGNLGLSNADGAFVLNGVAPGGYGVLARTALPSGRAGGAGTTTSEPMWAWTNIRVDGRDVTGLSLRLAPGQQLSGHVKLETNAAPPASPLRMTVSLRPLSPQGVNVSQSLPAVAPGEPFTITGIIPSAYSFNAIVSGWTLKSAMWNGRDVADVPLDIKPGQDVSNIVLTFTDRMAEVTGVLYDATGKASSDLGVVLFPVDRAMLIPGSRRVRAPVRPGTDGRFAFSNLVAGEYYLAVVGDVSISTADLVSPQLLDQLIPTAIKLVVADGERKVQDIRIK